MYGRLVDESTNTGKGAGNEGGRKAVDNLKLAKIMEINLQICKHAHARPYSQRHKQEKQKKSRKKHS